MKWFKFYGQNFITDSKMGYLTTAQRLIWVYLLSMASQSEEKDGVLKFVSLNHLRALAGITENDENWKLSENTFELFQEMGLITISNEIITIVNYKKYQESALTNAERQSRYRKKVTDSNENVTTSNANSNARVDKNREDKKRINKREDSLSYLENIPLDDFLDIDITEKQLRLEAEKALNWLKANNKRKKDYKAYLRNWVLKSYRKKVVVTANNEADKFEIDDRGIARLKKMKEGFLIGKDYKPEILSTLSTGVGPELYSTPKEI